MSDEKKQPQNDRTTTTTTEKSGEATTEEDLLTPTEEKAVRMVHGLAEDDDHTLQFGLGANEEAMSKLASLEKFLVDKFAGEPRKIDGIFEKNLDDNDAKRMIIDRLKENDES
ncbi:MAG: hypothetical protein ACQEVA_15850 [Myxococcota bacterium]